jgi:hypothetical protein
MKVIAGIIFVLTVLGIEGRPAPKKQCVIIKLSIEGVVENASIEAIAKKIMGLEF